MLNADTLTNKMSELLIVIRKYNPDVIMVNEVLPENLSQLIHLEEFAIQGYDMVPHDNIVRNKGRGSIIYVNYHLSSHLWRSLLLKLTLNELIN